MVLVVAAKLDRIRTPVLMLSLRAMTYTRINHPENLNIALEYDSAYGDLESDEEFADLASRDKIVISGESTGVLEDCSYVYVEPDYQGEMSMGQRELYEALLALQSASVYTVTTVGKLTTAIGLTNPLACAQRFANLQSLGAISGLKWNKP